MTGRAGAALPDVSRETLDRLEAFVELLERWNTSINLISRGDFEQVWTRHIADSAQLLALAPKTAASWLDLGAGAGFPGLVCAAISRETRPGLAFTLVESDTRKAAFLREAARHLELSLSICQTRIETAVLPPGDVISARALAILPRLLELSHRFCHDRTCLLFPKGRRLESELTQARQTWHIVADRIASRTDPDGTILRITEFGRHP